MLTILSKLTVVLRLYSRESERLPARLLKKELNVIKHMLRLAVEWDFIPFNPTQDVKSPKVPAGLVRYLQPTELRIVLEACPEWLRVTSISALPLPKLARMTKTAQPYLTSLESKSLFMRDHRTHFHLEIKDLSGL